MDWLKMALNALKLNVQKASTTTDFNVKLLVAQHLLISAKTDV